MLSSALESYKTNLKNPDESTLPSIMDEATFFEIFNDFADKNITPFDDFKEQSLHQFFIFDIPEWKKEFNIESVRKVIQEIALAPYSWKNIYVLRHFDTAWAPAQNALLKILEEVPSYAVLILLVKNPNDILDTIHSRCLLFYWEHDEYECDEEIQKCIRDFFEGEKDEFIALLYSKNWTREEAIAVMNFTFPFLEVSQMKNFRSSLENLYSTYENPRSILDNFFLEMFH